MQSTYQVMRENYSSLCFVITDLNPHNSCYFLPTYRHIVVYILGNNQVHQHHGNEKETDGSNPSRSKTTTYTYYKLHLRIAAESNGENLAESFAG